MSLNRRDWLKATVGGGTGLAIGGLLDAPAMRASNQGPEALGRQRVHYLLQLLLVRCGMIATVRDGKLLTMEGDYDHIVNRGALCVKGISMHATHASPQRLTTPRYRAPGSDHWEDISWDDAIARVAQKVRKTATRRGSPPRRWMRLHSSWISLRVIGSQAPHGSSSGGRQ